MLIKMARLMANMLCQLDEKKKKIPKRESVCKKFGMASVDNIW